MDSAESVAQDAGHEEGHQGTTGVKILDRVEKALRGFGRPGEKGEKESFENGEEPRNDVSKKAAGLGHLVSLPRC